MRTLALIGSAAVLLTANSVAAQSLEEKVSADEGESAENLDALPGPLRVTSATNMRTGLALGVTLGYGYTEDVLQLDDSHHRMRGAIAATFRPVPAIAVGLRLDGRYDRHSGGMIESDDGWVGNARVNVVAARQVAPAIGVGAQLVGWVPGGFAGFSVDAKGLLSVSAGPALVSANVGFRLDRSAESIDNADMLSASDRLALGVSDSNAVLLGLAGEVPLGSVELLAEASWDLLIGSDAPPAAESPLRVGAGARFGITDSYRVAAMLEGSFGRAPFVDATQPLVPVEPLIGINFIVSQRPKGTAASLDTTITVDPVVKKPKDEDPKIDPRKKLAGLSGTVRDDKGAPIAGAVVRLAGREVLTGSDGTFVAEQLEPGKISVTVSADGFRDESETVEIADDKVREINLILKRLETGTLRGVVRGWDGSPVVANIKIEPGNYQATSKADGTFEIKLPAGKYTATAQAEGFKPGKVNADINVPGPTVIVNIELAK